MKLFKSLIFQVQLALKKQKSQVRLRNNIDLFVKHLYYI